MAYYRPEKIREALEILHKEGEELKPLAGCTDVGVARQEKVLDKHSFIDLSYINEMKNIKEDAGYIEIGALVTHAQAAGSEILKNKASILCQACSTVGSPQIRNRGTIGGNISHGSPSGDSIPALFSLNAEFCLEQNLGERWVKSTEYFTGPGKTIRKNDELLTKIRIKPLDKSYFMLFQKLGQRKSLSCSKASMAFTAKFNGGSISDVRIAMGAVAPTVVRAPRTEKFLENKEINEDIIKTAMEMVSEEVSPIDDLRSTACYRKDMMGILLEKALKSIC